MKLHPALQEAFAGIDRCEPALVGVSGGADSMCLLDILALLNFKKLTVCHFDHGLRPGDAARECAVVRRAARRAGAAFAHGAGRTHDHAKGTGKGLEATARELRYAFFLGCAETTGCVRLFLAHHLNDQAETVLFNLCRGAGAAGLSGMARESRHGKLLVIRPLLGVPRLLLREHLRKRRIRFCEDSSNADPGRTRNRLRHNVLPALEEAMSPSFLQSIGRTAQILRADNEYLESLVPEPGGFLPVASLAGLPLALRRRLVLRWLRAQGVPEPGFEHIEGVLSLLGGRPAKVNLPGARHARRRAGRIFLDAGGN